MSAMIKGFLSLIVLSSLVLADSIGYVAAESPDFGDYANEDVEIFFDEVVELSYEICSDAGVTVASKLRLTQGRINFKDIKYTFKKRKVVLRPSDANMPAIAKFYEQAGIEGREFLHKIATENRVDALFYAKFKKSSIRKILKNMKKGTRDDGKIVLIVQLYLAQSNATTLKKISIDVSELTSSPTYDLDVMQSAITKEYLVMFERALKTVQLSGGIQREDTVTTEYVEKDTKTEHKAVVKQAAKEKPVYDDNW